MLFHLMLPLLVRQCVVELDLHVARIALSEGPKIVIRSERQKDEPVAKALHRLAKSLAQKRANPTRPAKRPPADRSAAERPAEQSAAPPLAPFRLVDASGAGLDAESLHHGDAWRLAKTLNIGGEEWECVLDRPRVVSGIVRPLPLAGAALVAQFVTRPPGLKCDVAWSVGGGFPLRGLRFTPSFADVGSPLTCTVAINAAALDATALDDLGTTVLDLGLVQSPTPGGAVPRAWARARAFQRAAGDGLRIVSYNLLAECHSRRAKGAVPAHAETAHRLAVAGAEVEAFDADLYCFQEVDLKLYVDFWVPLMSSLGYGCLFSKKTGPAAEGVATFYKKDRLALKDHDTLPLQLPNDAAYDKIFSVALISRFSDLRGGGEIVSANAHLYFANDASAIRTQQIQMILDALAPHRESGAAAIVAGDLNATPETAPVSLALQSLRSAYGLEAGPTHVVQGFVEMLDYIILDKQRFETTATAPLPPADGPMPTLDFPSDHFSLAADLRWANGKGIP
ncbi:Endonuclease/exonuclease/phosphatase [Pelagophyceae sp. CCMP2097]|nr:Endonuclease/exonuclease/phosphatase [Pelagophyceae sp. CCMP2097]|mmetsp:Transcript_24382/g.82212  ORF Transcript_24382/g.82212 Transcript_24382/m.82212 type:complete len:510 (+) Transcript_24382:99-1628(+)